MRRVKSVAELTRMALSAGARADYGGEVVNATRARAALPREARAQEPPQEPKQEPKQPETPPATVALEDIAQGQRQLSVALIAMLREAMAARDVTPHGWDIEVVRRPDGLLKSLRLKPVPPDRD